MNTVTESQSTVLLHRYLAVFFRAVAISVKPSAGGRRRNTILPLEDVNAAGRRQFDTSFQEQPSFDSQCREDNHSGKQYESQ